jgi:hypothetical protein
MVVYISSSWIFRQLAAGQLLSGQPVRYKNSWRVTLLQPAGRAAVLGQPSSLHPHWVQTPESNSVSEKSTVAAHKVQIQQVLYVLLSHTL